VRTFTGSEIVIELALLLQTWKVLNPVVDTPSGVSLRAVMKWVFWVASAQVRGTSRVEGAGHPAPHRRFVERVKCGEGDYSCADGARRITEACGLAGQEFVRNEGLGLL
jgi:hypothetical protein